MAFKDTLVSSGNRDLIAERLEEVLLGKGYRVIGRLGEGNTRDVFEVEYSTDGGLRQKRVALIPKTEIDGNSVTTQINRSKGDLDEREVSIHSRRKSHPNVVDVYDAFKFDGRTVIIEQFFDSVSLEDLIRLSGPIQDPERFRSLFGNVINGLEYLHREERMLHRDIKPSNILVGKNHEINDVVKIADLQNAGPIENIREQFLPTRGGTPYTYPHLLNDFVQHRKTCASLRTDFYALGATMYYVLTGEVPFNFTLERATEGPFVDINGERIHFGLKEDGKVIENIDIPDYERRLERKLEKVPKRYKKLVGGLLSLTKSPYHDEGWSDYIHLKDEFGRAIRKRGLRENVSDFFSGMKRFSIAAGLVAGLLGGIGWLNYQDRNADLEPPALMTLLDKGTYRDKSIFDLDTNEVRYLMPVMNRIQNFCAESEVLSEDQELALSRAFYASKLGQKMSSALIRGIAITDKKTVVKEFSDEDGGRVLTTSLAPYFFVARELSRSGNSMDAPSVEFHEGQQVNFGAMYLAANASVNLSIADIYALYFTRDVNMIHDARRKSGNDSYYPLNGKLGYGSYLPKVRRELVDRCLSFYYMTDHTGEVHFDVADSLARSIPSNGLVQR